MLGQVDSLVDVFDKFTVEIGSLNVDLMYLKVIASADSEGNTNG
jgi:hypothetical protein